MATKKIKKSGLTLIELMVANVIAILAFMVLLSVSFSIQENIGITSGILGISEKGRFAINLISRDIREAKSIVSSHGTYSTDDDTIVLKVPSIDRVTLDIKDPDIYSDYLIYTLESSEPEKLFRIVDAYPNTYREDIKETITEYINTLSFSSGGTGLSSVTDKQSIKTVTVRIVTTTTLPGLNRTNEITTSVSLRNKEIGP